MTLAVLVEPIHKHLTMSSPTARYTLQSRRTYGKMSHQPKFWRSCCLRRLVIEVSPHIAEKSVFETRSVTNVKAIIYLVHDLTIPKEKFNTVSLSPGDFHLIVHGCKSLWCVSSECSPGFL